MAIKMKVKPLKEEEMGEKEGPETPPESPLFELTDAVVKKLIRSASERGYVTHNQLDALLSSDELKSEQIEEILAKFSEMGVNVVETKEARPEEEVGAPRRAGSGGNRRRERVSRNSETCRSGQIRGQRTRRAV